MKKVKVNSYKAWNCNFLQLGIVLDTYWLVEALWVA